MAVVVAEGVLSRGQRHLHRAGCISHEPRAVMTALSAACRHESVAHLLSDRVLIVSPTACACTCSAPELLEAPVVTPAGGDGGGGGGGAEPMPNGAVSGPKPSTARLRRFLTPSCQSWCCACACAAACGETARRISLDKVRG